jgi:hypothetical protein
VRRNAYAAARCPNIKQNRRYTLKQRRKIHVKTKKKKYKKKKPSLCKQLQLFINNRIFKYRARIHNAPCKQSSCTYYIVPAEHLFTKLVVNNPHSRLLHAGVSSTTFYVIKTKVFKFLLFVKCKNNIK